MADIRIRIELQRPGRGVEMGKLARLAEEMQKFLRMVAEDAGLDQTAGTWVAHDFYNQGVGFNADFQYGDIDHGQAASFLHLVDGITTVDASHGWTVPRVRATTLIQSARVATLADEGETVRLGFLNEVTTAVDWRPLQKARANAIIEHFESWSEYRGMLQGRIHSLYKEVSPPYFTLRDFASGELIRCEFKSADWPSLHTALERKDGVVLIAGWIRAKRVDRSIAIVRVERIQDTKPLSAEGLRAFFGSAPGWTGDMTSDDFIDAVRADTDGEQ